MKALILHAEEMTAKVEDTTQPNPSSNELLIKVHSIALNPIDPLYVANPLGATGRTVGSDFAGTIVSLGSSVPGSSGLKPGDRVAGLLQGACSINDRPGAFAEYLVSPWDLVWRISEGMSFNEAATMSLCGLTAAQVLFYRLGLDTPWTTTSKSLQEDGKETTYLFIYGASTSVALYAAQLLHQSARSSGKKILLLGAASKKNFALLKEAPYSYEYLVDYRDDDWMHQIRNFTDGKGVDYAYDCISEGSTVENVYSTLKPLGKMAIVRSRAGGAWTSSIPFSVEPIYGAVWEGLGESVQYHGMTLPFSVEARNFAVEFYRWLSQGGKVVANPVRLMPGGLERIVEDGFVLLGPGAMGDRGGERTEEWMRPVSGEKLVYRISE